ncbi:hypothetical protein EZS27_027146, partial [termite gut metagenome]
GNKHCRTGNYFPGGIVAVDSFSNEDFNSIRMQFKSSPASGFYITPGAGRNEVRIAYVLKKQDLTRALFVLQKALEAYPGRT